MQFTTRSPHYEHLRKKWIGKHKQSAQSLLQKYGEPLRRLTIGGLGGLVLLSTSGSGSLAVAQNQPQADEVSLDKRIDNRVVLAKDLENIVPSEVRKLSLTEESKITEELSNKLGVAVKGEMNGIRLNRSYGLIGGEQHLYRYPGDNLLKHFNNLTDWVMYGPAGIAPKLGAWGYFASSESEFDATAIARERYYVAVQTFLAPGFAENVAKYRDFFKFRKMLVVNPQTGQAVVVDVGDAGPAEWTGKHLGGSPEVMEDLGLAGGPRKGAVLYFFIDDPNDKIPLGPIEAK